MIRWSILHKYEICLQKTNMRNYKIENAMRKWWKTHHRRANFHEKLLVALNLFPLRHSISPIFFDSFFEKLAILCPKIRKILGDAVVQDRFVCVCLLVLFWLKHFGWYCISSQIFHRLIYFFFDSVWNLFARSENWLLTKKYIYAK